LPNTCAAAVRINPVIRSMPAHFVQRIRSLRRFLTEARPDAVIALTQIPNLASIVACAAESIPVIVFEAGDMEYFLAKTPEVLEWRNKLYPCASKLVFQTERHRRDQVSEIWEKAEVIPNPVPPPVLIEHDIDMPRPAIAAMGSLVKEKGFDILIRSFSGIAPAHPEWHLVIIGDGPQRRALSELSEDVGLRDRVHLFGAVAWPQSLIKKADVFAHSSLSEGLPNAVAEAMACGVPVVAFDCRYGLRELVRDGIDGVLVPPEDEHALAEGLEKLISDRTKRQGMGARARDVLKRFSVGSVLNSWEALLDSVI
jgi:glycosyltransferase involved in cell wall biosynthesis